MTQEPKPQPSAFGSPLQDAGKVRQDEVPLGKPQETQVGDAGGEGIVSYGRVGVGENGQKRRLAGIRLAQQADIGNELQLHLELPVSPPVPFSA